MHTRSDDEGLRWDDGDDPTHVRATEPTLAAADLDERTGLSSALLVLFGLFGGVFILYTVGWIITVNRMATVLSNSFFDFLAKVGEFLAIASPALWFVGVLYATRESPPWQRVLWLVLGVVLLIPVPFVFGLGATR